MKQRIRKIFCTVAASAVVMLSPSFAAAAAPKKFTPYSPTGESCPAPNADQASGWINPAFDVPAKDQQRVLAALEMMIGRDKPDGYFVERSTQSVNELRLLMRGAPFRDSMTAQDYADAQDLLAASRRDMADRKKQSIEQAAALRLASNRTGLSVDAIAKTAGEVDDRTWLHMIRSYGHDIGLGFYADQIDAALRVANPVMLEEIIFLKRHPRLPVMLSALHLQKSILPPAPAQGIAVSADDIRYLDTLGFDTSHPDAALQKFNTLYTPAVSFFGTVTENPLRHFAAQAEKDAAAYGISTAAAAAIRLANIRTGADFAYMMELSSAESSFDHNAKAATSSATGLYQFTEDTWLHMIRRYGHKYGLSHLASQIEAKDNIHGVLVARIENPFVRFAALELRRDPQLAALMSAEFQMRNKFIIECAVGYELDRTRQYIGHFLGSQGAIKFLNLLKTSPNANAVKAFGTAAAANKGIFYKRNKKGKLTMHRTVREVFLALDKKFETGGYEDHGIIAMPPHEEEQAPPLEMETVFIPRAPNP